MASGITSVPAIIPDNMYAEHQEDLYNTGEQPLETLRIMLLGKSGVGKSSSGNTILGRNVFTSDMKLKRVTRFCEKALGTVNVPVEGTRKVEEVPLAVIDTPGLFETMRNEEDVVREILKCVKLQEPGPHAFAFVVPVGRMTLEDQHTIKLIQAKFGPRVWDYTIVLFTHGDQMEGKTINDIITESDEDLRSFLRKCSGGFHVFNNRAPKEQEVTRFVAKIQTLVALNGGGHYHTGLYPEKERKIRERQESLLKERETDISRRENELLEHYQGEVLEAKKRELWMKEENKARLAAEKDTGMMGAFKYVLPLLVVVIILFASWAMEMPTVFLLLMLFIISVALLWVFRSEIIPKFSVKNE